MFSQSYTLFTLQTGDIKSNDGTKYKIYAIIVTQLVLNMNESASAYIIWTLCVSLKHMYAIIHTSSIQTNIIHRGGCLLLNIMKYWYCLLKWMGYIHIFLSFICATTLLWVYCIAYNMQFIVLIYKSFIGTYTYLSIYLKMQVSFRSVNRWFKEVATLIVIADVWWH